MPISCPPGSRFRFPSKDSLLGRFPRSFVLFPHLFLSSTVFEGYVWLSVPHVSAFPQQPTVFTRIIKRSVNSQDSFRDSQIKFRCADIQERQNKRIFSHKFSKLIFVSFLIRKGCENDVFHDIEKIYVRRMTPFWKPVQPRLRKFI
jgi:hypothetical protein